MSQVGSRGTPAMRCYAPLRGRPVMKIDGIAARTLVDFGEERLAALCSALDVSEGTRELRQVFRLLVRPWGHRPIDRSSAPPSNVADDGAPYEFCVAFSQGLPEVQ